MGIGDWGLGIGDWGLGPIPNPHLFFKKLLYIFYILIILIRNFDKKILFFLNLFNIYEEK